MVLETVESFWNSASKARFPKLKDFAIEMHSMFGNVCVWGYIFYDEDVKPKSRNRMADRTIVSDLLPLTLVLMKER